jgi:hypothetical protein
LSRNLFKIKKLTKDQYLEEQQEAFQEEAYQEVILKDGDKSKTTRKLSRRTLLRNPKLSITRSKINSSPYSTKN